MSSKKKPGKKTVVVTKKPSQKKERLRPTAARGRSSGKGKGATKVPLLFGWDNYKFALVGVGLIALGMLLMLGGHMPSPEVWDEDLIYSFRRTVLAPFSIVAGFLVVVYAIFRKS
jgi:hypothetical protein